MARARDVQDKLDGMSPERVAAIAAMFCDPGSLRGSERPDVYRAATLAALPNGRGRKRERLSRLREILANYQQALQISMSRYAQLRRYGPAVLSDSEIAFDYGLDVEQAMLWTLSGLESSIKHDLTRIQILVEEIQAMQEEL